MNLQHFRQICSHFSEKQSPIKIIFSQIVNSIKTYIFFEKYPSKIAANRFFSDKRFLSRFPPRFARRIFGIFGLRILFQEMARGNI